MHVVTIPPVRTFAHVEASKTQALKPLDEAAEVFASWQALCLGCTDDCVSCANGTYRGCIYLNDLMDECADVIQATCNLLAALGVTDLSDAMAACEKRNEDRGRYGER